ncbi:hypothetical protein [Flavobacterium hydrocarbonoxydans]|nr:hypothetical protein [Flavobacterium hydrocarbonoxydans]
MTKIHYVYLHNILVMQFEEYEYTGRITPLESQKMLNDEGMNVTL